MKKILIINGPNLNLLGTREPDIYGNQTFEEFLDSIKEENNSIKIDYFQSNNEAELINTIHQANNKYSFIIINPGAFTHTSVAITDAIGAIKTCVIEVHISNINSREEFRKNSITSTACDGMIAGLGLDSYKLALEHGLEKYN